MACECCRTGRCCQGGNCATRTKSQCASDSGSFTLVAEGNPCASKACNDPAGRSYCDLRNPCACANAGRQTTQWDTCDCTLAGNTCPGFLCTACQLVNGVGQCVVTCTAPRQCCAGVCCPASQNCINAVCVDKCLPGRTYCAGNGSSFSCCPADSKCCGGSGCLPNAVSVNFEIDVSQDDWVSTGLTIPAGATVTITAYGSAKWRLPDTDSTGPNGTADFPSTGICNVMQGVTHMRLIGRVGGNMFSVGASYSGQPGAGELELRQNDSCVSDNEGSFIGIASYPEDPCPGFTPASVGDPIAYAAGKEPPGPGAALKSMLRLAGIVSSPTCSCNARAAQMDAWGVWGSLKRLPEICGWLKEEADKRGMWFFWPAGAALILLSVLLAALKRPFSGNSK
jgi:hypothetical protein